MTLPPCCGGTRHVETLWLLNDKGLREKELGRVVVCTRHGKPIGDLLRVGRGRIKSEEWAMMVEYRGEPPYYFKRCEDGTLVPEGWRPGAAPLPRTTPATYRAVMDGESEEAQ